MDKITARLVCVGNICTQWSYLEYLASNIVQHFLQVDDAKFAILLASADLQRKIQIAISLAKLLIAEDKLTTALLDVGKQLNDLAADRNLAVHGVYFSKPNDELVIVKAYRGKYEGNPEHVTVERLRQIGAQIEKASALLAPEMTRLGIKTS